jgi:enoyl-CoA hydratase/carnithine racemase
MEYTILKPEMHDGVALLTISRPAAMNALNSQFFYRDESLPRGVTPAR